MATTARELSGETPRRIVEAMRASVAARGAAGSTFEEVARSAGVSRGLLHYYFGTKERLLVEVCRRDCDIRMAALEAVFTRSSNAEDLIDGLVRSSRRALREDPAFIAMIFELFSISRHNDEVAAEMVDLNRRMRAQLVRLLEDKAAVGDIVLGGTADAVATVLLSLGDGLAFRMLADPDHDWGPTVDASVAAVRPLIL